MEKRHELARFIVEFLYAKSNLNGTSDEKEKEEVLVEFSVLELKEAFEKSIRLFEVNVSIEDVEDTLFYLSRIEAIKIVIIPKDFPNCISLIVFPIIIEREKFVLGKSFFA